MADDIQPTGGEAGAGNAGAVEARFTQDDLNRAAASERRKAAALATEHEALKTKLAGFEESQKSESQKAIEKAAKDARAAADAEWGAKLTAREIDAKLELRLLQGGYDPDLAHVVKAKTQLSSVEDIDEAIRTALDGKAWAKQAEPELPKPASQGGAPSGNNGRGGRWTEQKVMDYLAANPRGLTREIELEIKRDMGWR